MRATPEGRFLKTTDAPLVRPGPQRETQGTDELFRSELEVFLRKELDLRQALQQQIKGYERELAALRASDERSADEPERTARLKAAEQELEGRVAELAAARASVAAEEARLAKVAQDIEARATKLTSSRNDRKQ